jgi:hypothetical protein
MLGLHDTMVGILKAIEPTLLDLGVDEGRDGRKNVLVEQAPYGTTVLKGLSPKRHAKCVSHFEGGHRVNAVWLAGLKRIDDLVSMQER